MRLRNLPTWRRGVFRNGESYWPLALTTLPPYTRAAYLSRTVGLRRLAPLSLAKRALWRGRGIACLMLAHVGLLPALSAQPAPNEAQVKAAFVYNFAKFVEWPDNASSGPIVVGVLGDPHLKAAINDTLHDKTVRGRRFEVRDLSPTDGVALCHILVIAFEDRDRVRQILHLALASPTLTIGDLDGFTDLGGVIELVLENNQFRFEINAGAARRGGLRVSSRLLRLARSVKGN